jgi:hypothetical protein
MTSQKMEPRDHREEEAEAWAEEEEYNNLYFTL